MKKNVTKKIFYSAAATAVFAGSAVTGVGAIANADDDLKQFDKDSIVCGEHVNDVEAYPYSAEPVYPEDRFRFKTIEGTIVWDWNKSGEVEESDEGIPDWEVSVESNDPRVREFAEKHSQAFSDLAVPGSKYGIEYELPDSDGDRFIARVKTFDGEDDTYDRLYIREIDPKGFYKLHVPYIDGAVYMIKVRNPENGKLVFSDEIADFKENPKIDENNDWGFIKTGSLSGTIVWDNDKSKSVSDDDERIEGHLVELLKDGKVVETVKTDSKGFYKFDKLDSGDYEIRVKSPDGGELSFSDESATVKLGEEDKNNDWGFVKPDPAPEESPEPSPSDEPTPSEPSPSESPEPEPSTSEEPSPETTPSDEPTPETTPRDTPTIPEPEPRETPDTPVDTPSTTKPAARIIPSSPAPVITPPAVNHTFPEKQPTPENPSRVNTPPFVPAQPPIAGPVSEHGPVVNTGGAVQESFWTKIVNLFR